MKNKSGLQNAGFGEIGATLKALENAGVTLEQFSRLRSDEALTKRVANLLKESKEEELISLLGWFDNDWSARYGFLGVRK